MNIPFYEAKTETKTDSESEQESDDEDREIKEFKRDSYEEIAIRNGFKTAREIIRERRIAWLGHILRNKDNDNTTYAAVIDSVSCDCKWWKQTKEMLSEVDLTWEEMQVKAYDKPSLRRVIRYGLNNLRRGKNSNENVPFDTLRPMKRVPMKRKSKNNYIHFTSAPPNMIANANIDKPASYLMTSGWHNAKQ